MIRQMASSASASALVSADSLVSKAYALLQAQLMGAFGVMPCLTPDSLGNVGYGVRPEMGLVIISMARRAVDELRARNASLPPHVQIAKVEKLIEDRKKVSKMVRLVTRLTTLMSID